MPHFPKPWYRTSNQKWYVQLHGKQHDLGTDRDAAFDEYHKLMAQPREVASVTADTVIGIIDLFLEWCQAHRAEGTYVWYQKRAQSFVKTISARLKVNDLKPYHLDAWLKKHKKWNPGMQRGCLLAIQRAMNWAVKKGHIDRTPLAGVEKPPQGKRELVIDLPEFKKMLSKIRDQEFNDLVTFSWECGSRPQEIVRVEAVHVDLQHQRWVLPLLKSKGKKRNCVVYFTRKALAIIKRLMLKHPEGPLFRNSDGMPWTAYAISCRFGRLKKKLGVKYCLTNFRHTWVTRKLKAGVNSVTVAMLANHVDGSMIGRVYQHVSQDASYMLKAASV
ncbi:MAG: tyrosine-type recombinase/integrase [Gemmatales bacterium]